MPQKFSPRPFSFPAIHFTNAEAAANTIWTRAQNLNRGEEPLTEFSQVGTLEKRFCGFCRACLANIPENGDTKRTRYRSGLQGLCRSANFCSLCIFYTKLILARCGDIEFQDSDAFTVYTRNLNSQQASAYPIINIGFQIKTHCMLAMAFCPDLSNNLNHDHLPRTDEFTDHVSIRPVWGRTQPTLQPRAHLFREWLNNCETGHPKCIQHKLHGLPTRLLQIDFSTGSDRIRIISLSYNPKSIPYVALSHRWGSSNSVLSTTTSNLRQFSTAIPIEKLPKNFLDAIEITKALGLTYLWIDSLCIVQDSEADWAIESAKMDVVYQNAIVTIAASSSSDAHGGCFLDLPRSPFVHLRLPVSQTGSKKGLRMLQGTLRSTYASCFTVADSPLNTRGWVFQEMALSSRILYFTKEQVFWQCREAVESEDGTMLESGVNLCSPKEIQERSLSRLLLAPNLISESDLVGLWWSWVADYSARDLSEDKDRLYAFAGITKFYQRIPGSSKIVLGLLRNRLLIDLQWTIEARGPYQRIRTTNLPSWTWLGYTAPISNITLPLHNHGCSVPVQTTIVSVDISWSGDELITPLKQAELRIRGRIIRARVGDQVLLLGRECETTNLIFPCGRQFVKERNETISYSATAIFDDMRPSKDSEVYCLEMQMFFRSEELKYDPYSFPQWSPIFKLTQRFLVLKRPDKNTYVFERIGTGTARYDDVQDWSCPFNDSDLQLITLV